MPRPNLLFLMTDQQQAATVEPGSPCRTPNLDRLAARGTRFERCYTCNPICSPTRASLMTGVLPHVHGMVDCTHTVEPYRAEFNRELPFWPRELQAAGYRTGYFGKWHIERTNNLADFGFDEYDVGGEQFRAYRQSLGLGGGSSVRMKGLVRQKGYSDCHLYSVLDEPPEAWQCAFRYRQGLDFLDRAAQTPDQPWALFLSTTEPHDPYVAPGEWYDRYDPSDLDPPASFGDHLLDRPTIYRLCQRVWNQLEWPQFAQATACYYAVCNLLDDLVGQVLAKLDQIGQTDHTVVVYTSDHGDYMGAHRLMMKGVPAFEEAYRIPLILAGPGVAEGRVANGIANIMDLAPTLVELTAGREFPCYGRSLRPLLSGNGEDWSNETFAENHGQRFFYTQRVLWQGRYKYVFNGFDIDELYDLEEDPHELRNIAFDARYGNIREQMMARMWRIMIDTDDHNMHRAQYGMFRFAPVGPEAAA